MYKEFANGIDYGIECTNCGSNSVSRRSFPGFEEIFCEACGHVIREDDDCIGLEESIELLKYYGDRSYF